MFNGCFNNYAGFTSISKGKLLPKLMMPNIKFHGTENSYHHVSDFISAMALKGIDKNIFHLIFLWTFYKGIMRWYNTIDPWKVANYEDLYREF